MEAEISEINFLAAMEGQEAERALQKIVSDSIYASIFRVRMQRRKRMKYPRI